MEAACYTFIIPIVDRIEQGDVILYIHVGVFCTFSNIPLAGFARSSQLSRY
jgi:hypothetical protein